VDFRQRRISLRLSRFSIREKTHAQNIAESVSEILLR
jgi:hypothetical protein